MISRMPLVVVGSEYCAIADVAPETLQRLKAYDLATPIDGQWHLTPASAKFLPRAMEGEPLELPSPIAPPHFEANLGHVAR
jgi:hypothetical protein